MSMQPVQLSGRNRPSPATITEWRHRRYEFTCEAAEEYPELCELRLCRRIRLNIVVTGRLGLSCIQGKHFSAGCNAGPLNSNSQIETGRDQIGTTDFRCRSDGAVEQTLVVQGANDHVGPFIIMARGCASFSICAPGWTAQKQRVPPATHFAGHRAAEFDMKTACGACNPGSRLPEWRSRFWFHRGHAEFGTASIHRRARSGYRRGQNSTWQCAGCRTPDVVRRESR